jgi:tetratricopeptide (TPR) repeat protein
MPATATLRALALTFFSIAALGTAVSARAQAQDPAAAAPQQGDAHAEEVARQHFQLGRVQYENGQFRDAAASFERAYELSKREVLWYNIYLAYRDVGDNAKSAEALRNYLTKVEQIDNRAHLEARLASLDRLVQQEQERKQQEQARAAQAPSATEAAQPQSEQAQPAGAPGEPQQDRSSPSILPYVLMGVGGALVIGGVVTGLMASSKHSELEDKCMDNRCDPSLQSLADEGETLALTADILLLSGIAAAATGGVLWFLGRNDASESEQPVTAAAGCGLRGCGARVRLTF